MLISICLVLISITNIIWFLSVAAFANHYLLILPFLVLVIWVISSFTLHKICNVSLVKALRLDAFTYLVSIFLFSYAVIPSLTHLNSSKSIKLVIGLCYVTFVYVKGALFLYLYKKHKMLFSDISYSKLALVLLSFLVVFYSALALWTDYAIAPTGDEPYYLLSARSLIFDHELDISNNQAAMQWKSFMPKGYNLPVWSSQRPDGRTYFEGRELFIAFLAVPYMLGGFFATSLFMVILSSILITLMFYYMIKVGFQAQRSFWIALLIAFTQPMLTMNSRIYHNVLGALFILSAFLCLYYPNIKFKTATIWTVLVILALPWVHIFYTVFSLTLFFVFLYRYRHRKWLLTIFLLLCFFDAVIFIIYRANIRMGFKDFAAIHEYGLTLNVYRSLLALLFDQEGGLFFLSPVYIFTIIGIVSASNIDKSFKFLARILFVTSGYLAVEGSFSGFGGSYNTGRVIIPILPFMAVFLARCFVNNKFKHLAYVSAFASVFIGYITIAIPWLAINYGKGSNIFLKQFEKIFHLNISNFFPSFYVAGHEHYPFIMLFFAIMFFMGYLYKPKFNWQ